MYNCRDAHREFIKSLITELSTSMEDFEFQLKKKEILSEIDSFDTETKYCANGCKC